jgi:hydrogenase-1 operon protein HyaE
MNPTAEVQAPPLLARLVDAHGACWVDRGNAEAFAAGPGDRVLFFGGDPVRFPECLDVAVVLPELQAAYPGRWTLGVVVPRDEDAVALRFGARYWPSLVFLRDGAYLDTVAGMLDWSDYVRRVGEALARPASRAPGVGIPVVAPGAGAGASPCH